MTAKFLLAASVTVLAAAGLFGWSGLRVVAMSVAAALLVESAFHFLARRSRRFSETHALLVGLLLACTLPPTVSWHIPVTGAALAVLIGHVLLGGLGNYFWHPAALARVVVQMLFHDELTPDRWPVLARGRLLWGQLAQAQRLAPLTDWGTPPPAPGQAQAWEVIRTVDLMRGPLHAPAGAAPAEVIAGLVRDLLAPWPDTLTGVAGGAIGEACALAVLVGGGLLLWQGFLRGRMVVAALASAAIFAALLPVHIAPQGEAPFSHWLPGVAIWQGLPVGLCYVCYHLTAGELLFVVLLLAPDPSSSPLTSRGHAVFGVLIGSVTVLLRVLVGLPAAGYWALLLANTCVPVINRMTRRRVFGT